MPGLLVICTDGGSRGNPGPASAAFVIKDHKHRNLYAKAAFLGEATNNVAEYTAIVQGLEEAVKRNADAVEVYSDSELIVRQLNGQYKVKNKGLKPLYDKAAGFLNKFNKWQVEHVRRENNKLADSLANEAMDVRRDVEKFFEGCRDSTGKKIRIGALISGGGRTALNFLEQIKKGALNASIPLVISSQSKAKGVQRAKDAGLQVVVIRKKDHPTIEEFSEAIGNALKRAKIDLVVQAGWLCLWRIPGEFENKVMNIHPALLPAFGGKGMWGHHVHQAVLERGCKISGCTVHFCTNEYDAGPIIIQRSCAVMDDDDADSLAARVFEQECLAYPEAVRLFAQGKLEVCGNRVKIKQA